MYSNDYFGIFYIQINLLTSYITSESLMRRIVLVKNFLYIFF